jgi:16S rRNA (guanine966-N2)-methyltransferase
MRITGGYLKGRKLALFRGLEIRPTSDMLRESIYNIIGQDLTNWKVLDLFAGSGSMGLEALSRGASLAVFIDCSTKSVNLIRKNLILCGLEKAGIVQKHDLSKRTFLNHLDGHFDLVFLDPPYGSGMISGLIHDLVSEGILSSPSLIIAETSERETLTIHERGIETLHPRIYGQTKLHLFRYEG